MNEPLGCYKGCFMWLISIRTWPKSKFKCISTLLYHAINSAARLWETVNEHFIKCLTSSYCTFLHYRTKTLGYWWVSKLVYESANRKSNCYCTVNFSEKTSALWGRTGRKIVVSSNDLTCGLTRCNPVAGITTTKTFWKSISVTIWAVWWHFKENLLLLFLNNRSR